MSSTVSDRIDGLSTSLALKAPCRVATTTNITLSGLQTINGISVVAGDRVLVKDQTIGSENGIYVVSSTAWTRALDFNGARDVVKGTAVRIADNSVTSSNNWVVTTENPITIGATAIVFERISAEASPTVYESFSAARAANHNNADSVTTASFLGGWAATVAGPKGGATYHRDGTTGTASTAYSGNNGFYDAAGDGFRLAITTSVNVYQFGATGDGVTDDLATSQAAINYIQSTGGGVVFFLAGTYELSAALTVTSGRGVFLRGEGASSVLQNSTSGNTIEIGDGVTQTNDHGVSGLFIVNSVAGGACIYARKSPNLDVKENIIVSTGVGGYGTRLEESWSSKIVRNFYAGIKGFGHHSSNNTHALWFAGNRMDGDVTTASIGIFLSGGDGVSIAGSNTIESFGGCGLYAEGTRALDLDGNYYEDNAEIGVTFTGDARTIKSEIILNGGSFPALGTANPCRGVSCHGNVFLPKTGVTVDSSIYLVSTAGFVEGGNTVAAAYNTAAAYIKTKHNNTYYQNENTVLGNSDVFGIGSGDVYIDVESVNNAAQTNYDRPGIRSMVVNPNFAPRFNAHEDRYFSPESYRNLSAGTNTLSAMLTEEKYQGRLTYDLTIAGAGDSHIYGDTVLEADYADYYDDTLWVLYAEVKAITGTPGFELYVDVGGGLIAGGSFDATTGNYSTRAIVFKPQTGTNFSFAWRVSGALASDVVRVTRPIVCPLGSVGDIETRSVVAATRFSFQSGDATPSVKLGTIFKTSGATTITDFDDGVVGQTIVIAASSAITITNNASILLAGAVNFSMTASDTLTLTMFDDQIWQEVARSIN